MASPSTRVCACASALLVLGTTPLMAAEPGPTRLARLGTRYIAHRQAADGSVPGFSPVGSTADAVLAFVAARRGPRHIDKALDFLAAEAGSATLGQKAKVVLAAVAGGRDPRAFGGRDLVADIEASQQPSGQYAEAGDFTAVTTHALAMLALVAAGEAPPASADQWLVAAQCPDGGWQYDGPHRDVEDDHCREAPEPPGEPTDFTTSDTNTTAYAVQALEATAAIIEPTADPFGYFALARDTTKGGYRYSHEEILFGARQYTDANSTALVLQSFAAAGSDFPPRARKALGALQYQRRCGRTRGAFAFTWADDGEGKLRRTPTRKAAARASDVSAIGATIGAVPGLLLKSLPIAHFDVTRAIPKRKACR